MNEIDIIHNSTVPKAKNFTPELLWRFIENVLIKLEFENSCMSFTLTDNNEIKKLNKQWRSIDAPTDVLTFSQIDGIPIPQCEDTLAMGDVIVSLEKVVQQAEELNRPPEEELRRVIIHGILHLKGMEHPDDDYECEMLTLQEQLVMEIRPGLK